ncbi:hypothetical protein BH18THE2_BH18THE2_01610 [soil metagenome]
MIHLYRFSFRALKYIQPHRKRRSDTSLARLMQDIVCHHLLLSGEKILPNQVNEPHLHVRELLYCILPNEFRIVPAGSSTTAGFLR